MKVIGSLDAFVVLVQIVSFNIFGKCVGKLNICGKILLKGGGLILWKVIILLI